MNDEENILSSDEFKEDYENTLRPKSIDEFIGQTDLKKNLKVFLAAAKIRKRALISFVRFWKTSVSRVTQKRLPLETMHIYCCRNYIQV